MSVFRACTRRGAGAVAILLACAGAAHAQPVPGTSAAPPASGVAVMPPRASETPQAAYPVGAHGDATVRLVVTVAADGTVADAKATAGDEPFVTAAVEAARAWTFTPATPDGVAPGAAVSATMPVTVDPATDV